MNIKTFRASSLQEGLDRVREELGEHARILHTREVDHRRFFGLSRERYVEITASEGDRDTETAKSTPIVPIENSTPENTETPFSDDAFLEQVLRSSRTTDARDYDSLYIKRRAATLTDRGDSVVSGEVVPNSSWRYLTLEQLNPTLLQRSLILKLEENIRFIRPWNLAPEQRKIVAFLGATGVGKTSTIAKIAAHYKVKEHKKVGLATTDVFRIAATDQLQRYADMLELPLETASDPSRLPAALRRLANCELILLDTPGTNPKNIAKLQMLASTLDAALVNEVLLVLAATSSHAVLTDTVRRFLPLEPSGIIVTKLDEMAGLHDLYQTLKTNSLPLHFFTMGQNISEDIEPAGPARLASLV